MCLRVGQCFTSVSTEHIIRYVQVDGRSKGGSEDEREKGGKREEGGQGEKGRAGQRPGLGRQPFLQHDGFIQRNRLTVQNSSFYGCDNTNTFISLLKLTF